MINGEYGRGVLTIFMTLDYCESLTLIEELHVSYTLFIVSIQSTDKHDLLSVIWRSDRSV